MSRAAYAREWYKNRTAEQIQTKRKSSKAWVQANKSRVVESQAKWRADNVEKVVQAGRKATRKILYARYGLSLEKYDEILSSQNGVCAICLSPPGQRALSVDHCHKTGVVRGLLCHSCNTGVGFLKDDPDLLKRAIHYLTRSSKCKPKK